MRFFEGKQPRFTQVPPSLRSSVITAVLPSSWARSAAANAVEPEPRMTRSNLSADDMVKTPRSAARRTHAIRKLPREPQCERMGLCNRQHPAVRMRVKPLSGGILGHEEVHLPAESVAHVSRFLEEVQGDDRARRRQFADPFGTDDKSHRRARPSARRSHARGAAQHGGEYQRVESAPGVELPSAYLEEVRGMPQRQSRADDVAGVVE